MSPRMSTKDLQDKLVNNMKNWQKIEDASVESTTKIMSKTDNPVIKMVMEIIQRDSETHRRVQQMVVDTLTKQPVSLTPEEMGDVWEMVENHLLIERRMVGLVKEALEDLKGKKMVVQEYLLNYLMADETKHDQLLDNFEKIKKGMYPYG
ncbi:MAG: hypothetical protein R3231_11285 [bacterium]|nr:hypothetical protein [bacterium]